MVAADTVIVSSYVTTVGTQSEAFSTSALSVATGDTLRRSQDTSSRELDRDCAFRAAATTALKFNRNYKWLNSLRWTWKASWLSP